MKKVFLTILLVLNFGCAENDQVWSLESDFEYFQEYMSNRTENAQSHLVGSFNRALQSGNHIKFEEKIGEMNNGFIYYALDYHDSTYEFTYFSLEGDQCKRIHIGGYEESQDVSDCDFLIGLNAFFPLHDLVLPDNISYHGGIVFLAVITIENSKVIARQGQLTTNHGAKESPESQLINNFVGGKIN